MSLVDNFVPRVAITKIFNEHYIKVMASKAFRTPSVQNIAYNENIKTEKHMSQAELGLQIHRQYYF